MAKPWNLIRRRSANAKAARKLMDDLDTGFLQWMQSQEQVVRLTSVAADVLPLEHTTYCDPVVAPDEQSYTAQTARG